jgi:hypothetical protein
MFFKELTLVGKKKPVSQSIFLSNIFFNFFIAILFAKISTVYKPLKYFFLVCPIWLRVFSFFSNIVLNEPGLGT